MSSILITGIHGFVGNNLIANLKEHHIIFGLDIVSPRKDGIVKTYSWNELGSVPDVDVIIHLAGKAHDTKKQTNAQVYFDINTLLTQKIFDWFLTINATKFIFFSSVKAVADSVGNEILTEDVLPAPKGPYGESKLAAENYLRERGKVKFGEAEMVSTYPAKKVYILRPCMIHGPGNKGNLNLLYKIVSKGIPWPLGIFQNKRSFTSIGNIQFIIQQLIENDVVSGTYNVADDLPLSTNELIKLISESQGKKPRIWKINSKVIAFFTLIGDKLHLPLNSERLRKLTESYVVSNFKIINALQIEKMPVTAEDGLKKTFESFL